MSSSRHVSSSSSSSHQHRCCSRQVRHSHALSLPVLYGLALTLAPWAPAADAQGRRLTIKNACERDPIWIAHEAGPTIGPDGPNIKIPAGKQFSFQTPPGLSATRYWPKMGCDEEGNYCTLGGSGGPQEACVRRPPEVEKDDYSNCAPPVDTKFEGTFGSTALPCKDGVGVQGCDYVDMSLVDGWTLPFKLEIKGECVGHTGTNNGLTIDCSSLTTDLCPHQEQLQGPQGITVDLRALNPHTDQVAGCYAPCQKLVDDKWRNPDSGRSYADPLVVSYCCPTPPETPEACRAGPISNTQFLKTVHGKCPGVYGYAYDDGMGLLRCSPTSEYELTFFCADGHTSFKATADAKRGGSKGPLKVAEARKAIQLQKGGEAPAKTEFQDWTPDLSKDFTTGPSSPATLRASVDAAATNQVNPKAVVSRSEAVEAVDKLSLPHFPSVLFFGCSMALFAAIVAVRWFSRTSHHSFSQVAATEEMRTSLSSFEAEASA